MGNTIRKQYLERTRKALEQAGWVVVSKGETFWVTAQDGIQGVYLSKDSAVEQFIDGRLVEYTAMLWDSFYGRNEA